MVLILLGLFKKKSISFYFLKTFSVENKKEGGYIVAIFHTLASFFVLCSGLVFLAGSPAPVENKMERLKLFPIFRIQSCPVCTNWTSAQNVSK